MKKILQIFLIAAASLISFNVFAATSSISDNELDTICAQAGAITVRIGNFTVESQRLKNIATDGWNYWDPDHDSANLFKDPHPNNPPGFFDGSSTTNPQKNPGAAGYNQVGYFGYDEAYLFGGTVTNTGYMMLEVVSTSDPRVNDGCKLEVIMRNQSVDAQIGFQMVMKLSDSPDLSGDQSLGRVYTQGIKMTNNGHLTVFAHNTPGPSF